LSTRSLGLGHLGKIAYPAQQSAGDTRRAARAPGDLAGAILGDAETHQPRTTPHDQFEFLDRIEIEAHRNAETIAQRRRQQTEAGRCRNQRELGKVDLHRSRRRPFADDQVELKILHGRIEDFLDRRAQPMDFVDEQDVPVFEIGQKGGEIASLGNHRPRGRAKIDTQLLRHDLRQGCLAEPGRTDEKHVIQRLAATLRSLDEHLEVRPRLCLAGEFVQRLRP
jgi:hypothetical protein